MLCKGKGDIQEGVRIYKLENERKRWGCHSDPKSFTVHTMRICARERATQSDFIVRMERDIMAFVNAKTLKRTAKILMIGPTGAGKTYGGLQLEGPIGAYSGEDGLRSYSSIFDFHVDTFDTIEELNGKMRKELLGDPSVLGMFNTIVIDGLTVAWHAALREIEEEKGQIDIRDQAKLKGPWKEFNELVYQLGKRDKNVWVTVQAKADWEIEKGKPPRLVGMKGDVTDKVWFAFDLVCYIDVVNGIRTVSVLKSRFPHLFQVGDVIQHFDVKMHFAPIFDGGTIHIDSDSEQEELTRMRGVVESKLRALGRESKGGHIPDDAARRIYKTIQNPAATAEDLGRVLNEVRAFEKQAQAASSAVV